MKLLAALVAFFVLLGVFTIEASAYLMQRGHVAESLYNGDDDYMVGRDYVEQAINEGYMDKRYGEFYREYDQVDPVQKKRIKHHKEYGEKPIYLQTELDQNDSFDDLPETRGK